MNIKTLGNNIEKIQNVITVLENVKSNWPEFVNTDQTFSSEFIDNITTLIDDLKVFKENLEECGEKADQYADWAV